MQDKPRSGAPCRCIESAYSEQHGPLGIAQFSAKKCRQQMLSGSKSRVLTLDCRLGLLWANRRSDYFWLFS